MYSLILKTSFNGAWMLLLSGGCSLWVHIRPWVSGRSFANTRVWIKMPSRFLLFVSWNGSIIAGRSWAWKSSSKCQWSSGARAGAELHGCRGQSVFPAGTKTLSPTTPTVHCPPSPTIELNGPQITQLFLYTSLPWQTKGLLLERVRP